LHFYYLTLKAWKLLKEVFRAGDCSSLSFIRKGRSILLPITMTGIKVFEWGKLMVEPGYNLYAIGFDSHSHSMFNAA
jgi:hypothetical protein